jgi:NADH:ubiquinone oxidoreductase subunit 6 (subunit J)
MREAFLVVALLTVGTAVASVLARKVMQAVLLLGLSFFGIAGLYAVLGQDFLAVVQVLVYVGAVTTEFLFAIMLSDRQEISGGPAAGAAGRVWALLLVVGFFGVMARDLAGFWTAPGAPAGVAAGVAAPLHSASDVGRLLFGEFLAPFELTSVILLAAVIGALVLARGEDER